jgi:predicted nucleic acid-binding protein
MAYLLDTGILLRLVDKQDRQHAIVNTAVGLLGNRGDNLVITTQNMAEFCNVATRPVANNGLGLAPSVALDLLDKEIEPICSVLAEPAHLYAELKRLIATYNVVGKQVHDARLAAMMLVWQVENFLTLNEHDFARYEPEGIKIFTPASILASRP